MYDRSSTSRAYIDVSKSNIESVHSPQGIIFVGLSYWCWWSLGKFSNMKTSPPPSLPNNLFIFYFTSSRTRGVSSLANPKRKTRQTLFLTDIMPEPGNFWIFFDYRKARENTSKFIRETYFSKGTLCTF